MSDYEALVGKTVCVRYAGVDDQHGLQHPVLDGVAVFAGVVEEIVRGCVARVRLTPRQYDALIEGGPTSVRACPTPPPEEVFLDLDQAEEILTLPVPPAIRLLGG